MAAAKAELRHQQEVSSSWELSAQLSNNQIECLKELYDEMRHSLEAEIEWRYEEQTQTHCELHETLAVLTATLERCDQAEEAVALSQSEARKNYDTLKAFAERSVRVAEQQRHRVTQQEAMLAHLRHRVDTLTSTGAFP